MSWFVQVDSKRAASEKTANHIVGEAVMGIRTVASYNLEQRFYENYCKNSGAVAGYLCFAYQSAVREHV